jgi:AcrR family transcriptional regulator
MARPLKSEEKNIPVRAVEAATALLEQLGHTSITMKKIAEVIGCSAPALYNHFHNKESLLRAVHDAGFKKLIDEKLAVSARTEGDGFQRLREGGIAYIAFALENPAIYQLMFNPPSVLIDGESPFEGDLGMRALKLLEDAVCNAQDEGYLPGADPEHIAFTLWAAAHGAASLLLQNRSPIFTEETGQAGQLVIDSVMAMIASTRSNDAKDKNCE